MDTAKCKEYLIQNWAPKLKAKYEEMLQDAQSQNDQASIDYCNKVIVDVFDPNKWKRVMKYNVGSNTDKENLNYCDNPNFVGSIVRAFYLHDTDHETINLIEKDGAIVGAEDVGD